MRKSIPHVPTLYTTFTHRMGLVTGRNPSNRVVSGLRQLTHGSELFEVQAGAGLTQQVEPVVQELTAGSCVQVLQLLHRDLGLNVHYAQDEWRVLHLHNAKKQTKKDFKKSNENSVNTFAWQIFWCLCKIWYLCYIVPPGVLAPMGQVRSDDLILKYPNSMLVHLQSVLHTLRSQTLVEKK